MTTKKQTVNWWELGDGVSGLDTDVNHEIEVQREAIPLIFVPGIMGSRLRRTGTSPAGTGPDRLPNLRWDPSSTMWMLKHVSNTTGAERKAMLVGRTFDPTYLEPDDTNPPGDGFAALMADYCKKFLTPLKTHDWGPLAKIFEFPVYAFGYNWTDSAENAGQKLAARINDIIAEAKDVVGLCEKVILISHSMGGLVSRAASELAGAAGSILGIVHGVQPVTGAPAAYWRIKAGFEGHGLKGKIASRVLGKSGWAVTPVLGNIPGGLQLLPNKLHRTNAGAPGWLTVTEDGKTITDMPRPKADPYEEIYRKKAVVRPSAGEKPSTNIYWGLVDPDLLNPGAILPAAPNSRDQMTEARPQLDPWPQFLAVLDVAERFHDALQKKAHPRTFCVCGVKHDTADVIEMKVESKWFRGGDTYSTRGFRGLFTNSQGDSMQAVLQDPAGDGDGTVVRSSATALDAADKQMPGDRAVPVEHQPAYEDQKVKKFAIEAIIALCKAHYEDRRHRPLGDFPAPSTTVV